MTSINNIYINSCNNMCHIHSCLIFFLAFSNFSFFYIKLFTIFLSISNGSHVKVVVQRIIIRLGWQFHRGNALHGTVQVNDGDVVERHFSVCEKFVVGDILSVGADDQPLRI